MVKIESLSDVGIFTRDQKKAKDFYVKKIGLKVRDSMPEFGYLALGATKGGEDANLNVWQPTPQMGGDEYDAALKTIGQVSGIGFRTTNLEKTVEILKRRGVKVESFEEEGEKFVRFFDADGNILFAFEPPKPKVRRAGFSSLDFITIASRDAERTGRFYVEALGFRKKKSAGENLTEYRASPRGTALMPFTPQRNNYENEKDYQEDMAHIGENTNMMLTTRDIYTLQEQLLSRGVRFKSKAEKAMWGGVEAEIFDPDDNVYTIVQPRGD